MCLEERFETEPMWIDEHPVAGDIVALVPRSRIPAVPWRSLPTSWPIRAIANGAEATFANGAEATF